MSSDLDNVVTTQEQQPPQPPSDSLQTTWIRQQHEIAAQVKVLADSVFTNSRSSERSDDVTNRRFESVNLNRALNDLGSDDGTKSKSNEDCNGDGDGALHNYYFGGVDVSFPESEANGDDMAVAVYVVLDARTMKLVYTASEYFELTVPYIPGFLAFREIDPLQRLVQQQQSSHPALTPRAVLVDGNGIWHARGAGIACFLGVRTGIPTIGVGKTLYYEAGWTKETVAHTIASSLNAAAAASAAPHDKRSTTSKGHSSISHSTCNDPLESNIKEDTDAAVLLVDCHLGRSNDVVATDSNHTDAPKSREALVTQLCQDEAFYGLAIPLGGHERRKAASPQHYSIDVAEDSTPSCGVTGDTNVLGCALVGHGGRLRGAASAAANNSRTTRRDVGSQNPIYISVGHQISLLAAVAICAKLSLARIPEPIRQADAIGRQLLREKQQQESSFIAER